MEHLLDVIMIPVQVIIVFYSLYYFVLALFGLMKKRDRHMHKPKHTFAAVICAHNEERVVGNLIDNLKELNYPRHMYDIYVVADNCTDHTAEVCRQHGAFVRVRTNKEEVGKGYAMDWMFSQMLVQENNMTPLSYSMQIIWSILNFTGNEQPPVQGRKVIQGYMDSKNPTDTWIAGTFPLPFGSSITCGIWLNTISACLLP